MSCNQVGCENAAAVQYAWPTDGERKRSCAHHAEWARKVAASLGYKIELRPLMCRPCLAEISSFVKDSDEQPVSAKGDFCFMCGEVVQS